jgi:DNA repair protein RecN (Recombination protein N)
MLAMKNVLSEQDGIDTMVFDEVDTGVSGRAAQRVAEKMARISRRKQVLFVTHLPQLAAMADHHFSVEKGEANGRTYTKVLRLDRLQRQRELARLTGGDHVSATMLSGAEELLSQAEAFKKTLA